MNYRNLGSSGLEIAPIVFGGNVLGWTTDESQSFRVLDAFMDHGFNAIDTADVYSAWVDGHCGGESETMLGKWFAARPGMREKVTLFTKVGSDMGSPEEKGLSERWIMQAVEKSLKRLRVEEIDLYFSHWPDPDSSHAETLGAYEKLLKAGKIRAIGASNLDAGQLSESLKVAQKEGLPAYQVLQPEYNLYDRASFDGALRDLCIEEGIGVVTYFSLASGFLSGKYRGKADLQGRRRADFVEKYLTEKGTRLLDALEDVANAHGAAPAEVALAWLIARDGVSAPIASATDEEQIASFAKAASLRLSDDDMSRLTAAGD